MIPLRALGELPALPLHTAGKYVAGAYIVAFALVLVYVVVLTVRVGRMERQLGELLDEQGPGSGQERDVPRREPTL